MNPFEYLNAINNTKKDLMVDEEAEKKYSAFMVNIFNDHSVINNSSKDRIHLIAHCYLGNKRKEFCELIVNSYEKQHAKIQSQV